MAKVLKDVSRTFNEYLLLPNLTDERCIPSNVSLKTPLVKYKKGEEAKYYANVPMVSAIMQSVSGEEMGIALAREGGVAFIYGAQSIESQANMVRHVKKHKAGFVISDSNVKIGTDLGILPELTDSKIQKMYLYSKPANMQKYLGEQYEAFERDIKRAEVIKNIIKEK